MHHPRHHPAIRYWITVSLALGCALAMWTPQRAGADPPSEPGDLFDPDRVIRIELTLAPEDWRALRISHRVQDRTTSFRDKPYEYYPADVTIDGITITSVGVRKKGFFGSVVSTRPSLKIKFGEYEKGRRFGGLDMMTLNNDNQDPTHAQQLMSYNFMRAAGAPTPRCTLAHVVVNGEDLGIYSHVESIRKPFIRRHFKKANGDLYEGYAGDFTTAGVVNIIHKWGKDDGKGHLSPLVNALGQPGPVSVAEVERLVDLDGFITLWASEVLLGHWDGYAGNRNNYYLYRDRKTDRLHFIPWGADSVFNDPGIFIDYPVPKSVKAIGLLCRRLWELPEIRTRYRAELQRQLDDAWNEDTLLAQLERAMAIDAEHRAPDDRSAADAADRIRTFIAGRRAEIQAELDGPAPDWPENPDARSASGPPEMMNLSGSFATVMQERLPQDDEKTPGSNLGIAFGEGTAHVEYRIGDDVHTPFTRFGVRAFPDSPMSIRRGYPCIELRAANDEGDRVWTLTMMLDPHQLETGENDLPSDMFTVWSVLKQGTLDAPDEQQRWIGVSGRVKLDQFRNEPGATISGTFELATWAFEEREPTR